MVDPDFRDPNAVKFNSTKEEHFIIVKIVSRAIKRFPGLEPLSLSMDIDACHSNGVPLNLKQLLTSPDGDFNRDILGIRRYMDRTTGKLTGTFMPRCAKKNGGLVLP